MEQKIMSMRLYFDFEMKELNAEIKKLNDEGWKVESVSVEGFKNSEHNLCYERIAHLLCTKAST